MINLFIDSEKRLWAVDERGRLRRDAHEYLLFFGENEFEEIEITCVPNVHGNIISHYDTLLVVRSDEEHTYPVAFSLTDEGVLKSDEIPVDQRMTATAGNISVYVRFEYQNRVIGRTNPIFFKVRSSVCGGEEAPQTLSVIPDTKPQEFSCEAGYDRVEVAAVESEELSVTPIDARQVFLPSEKRYFSKVTVERPELSLEDIEVTPSTERRYITADEGHYAIRSVSVAPISDALDLQIKRANPTTQEQTVTADGEYVALSEVRVSPVTAQIDTNISPMNIRKDVEILGVRGEMEPIEIVTGDEDDDPCIAYLYDYDGTPVASYTAEELAELEALPVPPSHSGLRFLRYNRTKDSMVAYLTDNHTSVSAGALYETDDGHTRFTVMPDLSDMSARITLGLEQARLNIDWGDGSTETITENSAERTLSHTYPSQGEYVIDIEIVQGAVYLGYRNGNAPLTSQSQLIRSAEIGRGVAIPQRAFYGCSLMRSVVLPDTLTSLPTNLFTECYSLEFVALPDSISSLANNVFASCYSLREVAFPDTVTSVGIYAFRNCGALERAILCRILSSLGNNTFESCGSLKSAYIGESLTTINEYVFSECRNLVSVNLPDTVTEIRRYAFNLCGTLRKIAIPDHLITIGERAFYSSALRTVDLPDTLTSIGNSAFSECRSLKEIEIPSSTTSLGTSVFQNCSGLERVHTGGVGTIPMNTFANCWSLSELTIGDGAQRINGNAIISCRALSRLYLPPSVIELGMSFVSNCYALAELDLSDHTAPPTATNAGFSNLAAYTRIYVRDEATRALFLAASGWSSVANRIFVKATA